MDAFTLQLKLLIEQIELLEAAINETLEKLRLGPDTLYRHVLETILGGIGPVLAAAVIGDVGDMSRFPSAKTLVGYASLDVTVRTSG